MNGAESFGRTPPADGQVDGDSAHGDVQVPVVLRHQAFRVGTPVEAPDRRAGVEDEAPRRLGYALWWSARTSMSAELTYW